MAGDAAVPRAVALAATVAFGVGALFGARFRGGKERSPAPTDSRAEKTRAAAAGATSTSTPREARVVSAPSEPSATRRPSPATRQRSETVARPIGSVHSCFSRRNGTPRQGGDLVPNARCVFFLAKGLPRDLLSGLDAYSHVWVLYEFHANTNRSFLVEEDRPSSSERHGDDDASQTRDAHATDDDQLDVVSGANKAKPISKLEKRTTKNGGAVRAKVRVPRLDGAPVGALATRTPHRPTPIGLSLGKIIHVDLEHGALTLAGCDVVDGTPVLDVKPYVPFCDAVPNARAPVWVRKGDESVSSSVTSVSSGKEEPLKIAAVRFAANAESEVANAYLRSVKARRARRLEGQNIDPSFDRDFFGKRTGKKPVATRPNEATRMNDETGVVSDATQEMSADEKKQLKRALKLKRQAGLAFPDALYDSGEAFVSFVKEVLALDVRTYRERNAKKEAKKFETYRVVLCDVEVEYEVLEEKDGRVVVVIGGTETEPLEKPGVTADRRPEKKTA